jgi:hypothetical protein
MFEFVRKEEEPTCFGGSVGSLGGKKTSVCLLVFYCVKFKIAREPFLDRAIPNLPVHRAGEDTAKVLRLADWRVNQNLVREYLG